MDQERPRYPLASDARFTTGDAAATEFVFFRGVPLPRTRVRRALLGWGTLAAVAGLHAALRVLADELTAAVVVALILLGTATVAAASLGLALARGRSRWEPRVYNNIWLALALTALLWTVSGLGYANVERTSPWFDVFDTGMVAGMFVLVGYLAAVVAVLPVQVTAWIVNLVRSRRRRRRPGG